MLLRLSIFSPLFLGFKHIQTTIVSGAARPKNPALTEFPLTHCHDLQEFMGEQNMSLRKSEPKTEMLVLFFPRVATSLPQTKTNATIKLQFFHFFHCNIEDEEVLVE